MSAGVQSRRPIDVDQLVEGVIDGDRRLLARCLRVVDDHPKVGREIAARLFEQQKGAQIIGITGNPGAGKSTVVDQLVIHLRKAGKRVAILAIDPSSPFSGGAILGDRIRMSRHFEDDGVFIRSLATRGALGGLSRSTFDSARVLDAAGYDVILVETVGVGQDEVDVVRLADTTVVVLVPGLGDDIQAIKAGLLEIADVFLINKADREGAPDVERGLRQMMSLVSQGDTWETPILKSVAARGQGLEALLEQLQAHSEFLKGPEGHKRVQVRQRELFQRLLDAALVERGRAQLGDVIAKKSAEVMAGADPYQLVADLVESPV